MSIKSIETIMIKNCYLDNAISEFFCTFSVYSCKSGKLVDKLQACIVCDKDYSEDEFHEKYEVEIIEYFKYSLECDLDSDKALYMLDIVKLEFDR